MDKTNCVSRQQLKDALINLGVNAGMVLEVHSSLSSFGHLNARRKYLYAGAPAESGI